MTDQQRDNALQDLYTLREEMISVQNALRSAEAACNTFFAQQHQVEERILQVIGPTDSTNPINQVNQLIEHFQTEQERLEQEASRWYGEYDNECIRSANLSDQTEVLQANISRSNAATHHGLCPFANHEYKWDRAPDTYSIRLCKSGEFVEVKFIEGERCVEICFYENIEPQISLMTKHKHYGWCWTMGDTYVASQEARDQAWFWLCGHERPDISLKLTEDTELTDSETTSEKE